MLAQVWISCGILSAIIFLTIAITVLARTKGKVYRGKGENPITLFRVIEITIILVLLGAIGLYSVCYYAFIARR